MPQNDPILESAQQIVKSGTAPILGDDGKVAIQDVEQGGYFGQTRTDDQGTYVEYFEPYQPPELELTEGVPLVGTAAMSFQADPRRGEDNFVTKKVYLYPNQEFANTYNNLQPEEREALIRTDEDFRTKTWNFAALDQYSQSGVTSQGQWELTLGGIDVDVSTARQALENVSKKSYEKIAQADSTLQQIVPEQYKRLSEIEDELFELESADELARDDSYYNVKKLELESEYRRILQTPVQTEQGEVPLGNLDAWRQRLYSEQDRAQIQNSFWQVYEGSDEQRRQQFYQSEVEKAANDLGNWYEKAGAAGYYANLGLRKIARATMDVAANAVGVFAMTPLADLVGHPEAKDWAENMAMDLSIAARAVQGDANAGSMNRYEYALDDNRTAVVDRDGSLLSIENTNGFNLMRNMTDQQVSQIQQQVISDRNKIYEDSSWGRLGSEVVDVGLDMGPILMGAGGIGRITTSAVLKATGKEMLEKGTKMALFQGASAASAFVNTLGRNYTSALEQGLNRENATKLALTQSAIEGLAMSVVGGIEARTAAVLSGSVKNQAANAIRGYMTGYYSLDGVAKRLGKVGIQAGKDVVSEVVEENLVEWSQGLAATNYGLEGSYTAQDASNITATTIGLTLLMGGGIGTYRHQFRESRQAPTLDEMGQWRAQLVDKVMTNMDSVERLAKTIGASANLTPEQVNQKVLQLRHAKQQYDALPPDMSVEERSEYISNVIEIETIKESLPNLNEDQILWENQISILERRNREILGAPPESSPVSDEISERADELASENEISAPQGLPSLYGQVEEDSTESTAEQPAEQEAVEDQYVSRDIGGETMLYKVLDNGLLSIVNEVPEGATVLTQEEFDGQRTAEEVQPTAEPQEIDNFIAEEGNNILFEQFTGDIVERVDNAEDIPLSELESSTNSLYSLWDNTDNNENLSSEQKERIKSKIENVITKLENYEFATETETVPATTKKASRGVKIIGTKKKGIPSQYEVTTERIDGKDGYVSTPDGRPVRGKYRRNSDGSLDLVHDGGTIPIDSQAVVFQNTIQDESGTVTGVIARDRNTGNDIVINDPEIALDMYIKHREQTEGLQEDPLFEEVFEEVVESEATTRTTYPRLDDRAVDPATDRANQTTEAEVAQETPPQPAEATISEQEGGSPVQKIEGQQEPATSSYVSNTGKEIQVQRAEDGNWYRTKTDGSMYKNPISNQDYINQIEENASQDREVSDGIEQGQQTIGELSIQEEGGRSEGSRTNVEESPVVEGDREANQTEYTGEPEVVEEQPTSEVESKPESLAEIGRKAAQLKGQERIDALVEDAPALLEDNVTARQIFEEVDKKIPLNKIEDILAEAAVTAEGAPKTATSNNIGKVAKALGIGTKSKIKEGGKVVNVIKDQNGNWKRTDKEGNFTNVPLTVEQIAEANANTSNLFQTSDIDRLIELGLIEKKDC